MTDDLDRIASEIRRFMAAGARVVPVNLDDAIKVLAAIDQLRAVEARERGEIDVSRNPNRPLW